MEISSDSNARLQGYWLSLARVAWVSIALLAVGVLVAAVPYYYQALITFALPEEVNPQTLIANLAGVGASPQLYAVSNVILRLIFAFIYISVALFIFIRRSSELTALVFSLALLVLGVILCDLPTALGEMSLVGIWIFNLLDYLAFVLFLAAFYIFPDGHFVPQWTRGLMMVWVVVGVPYLLLENTSVAISLLDSQAAQLLLFICPILSVFLITIFRYRRVSTLIERQQTKWAVSGFSVALAVFLIGGLAAMFFPMIVQPGTIGELLVQSLFFASLALIPLSIGMAVLRSHLWDIDLIIRRTLIYSLLTAALAMIYVGCVFLAQIVFQRYTQQASSLVIVLSTLTIAALFAPLRRRIQRGIDRRFYRRKYDLTRTLEVFNIYLRNEVDLDRKSNRLVSVVEETLQPRQVSLWLRATSGRAVNEIGRVDHEKNEIRIPS